MADVEFTLLTDDGESALAALLRAGERATQASLRLQRTVERLPDAARQVEEG